MSELLCICPSPSQKSCSSFPGTAWYCWAAVLSQVLLCLVSSPLGQSTVVLFANSYFSFLPLQMGRASRIYFCGKHNPCLLLQYCYEDRKWSRDRRQIKSSSSLSFPLRPSTHMPWTSCTGPGKALCKLLLYFFKQWFCFSSSSRTKILGGNTVSRQGQSATPRVSKQPAMMYMYISSLTITGQYRTVLWFLPTHLQKISQDLKGLMPTSLTRDELH